MYEAKKNDGGNQRKGSINEGVNRGLSVTFYLLL